MNTQQQARQGDVLVDPIKKRRKGTAVPPEHGRIVLAHGEVTGHAHIIAPIDDAELERAIPPAVLEEAADGSRTLIVARPCVLRHDEHDAIALAGGAYRVIRQHEYTPAAIRQVAD